MVPPPDRLKLEIRAALADCAAQRRTLTYRQLAQLLDLRPPLTIHRVTLILEELMTEDHSAGRPLLSACCISQAGAGLPRLGFFLQAQALGLFSGDPEGPAAREFHARELARLFAAQQQASERILL